MSFSWHRPEVSQKYRPFSPQPHGSQNTFFLGGDFTSPLASIPGAPRSEPTLMSKKVTFSNPGTDEREPKGCASSLQAGRTGFRGPLRTPQHLPRGLPRVEPAERLSPKSPKLRTPALLAWSCFSGSVRRCKPHRHFKGFRAFGKMVWGLRGVRLRCNKCFGPRFKSPHPELPQRTLHPLCAVSEALNLKLKTCLHVFLPA